MKECNWKTRVNHHYRNFKIKRKTIKSEKFVEIFGFPTFISLYKIKISGRDQTVDTWFDWTNPRTNTHESALPMGI